MTWALDHLAAPLTGRTGPLQRKKALRMADAPLAAAGSTGFGSGTRLCSGAGASFAGHRSRDAHLRRLTGIGLIEPDIHVVAKVRSALAT